MWHGHGNVLHQTQVIILFQIPEWVSSERRPSQIRPQHLLRSMINTPAIKPCFWPGSLSLPLLPHHSSEDSSQGYSEKSTAAHRAHNDWGTTAILSSTTTDGDTAYHKQPANQFTLGETVLDRVWTLSNGSDQVGIQKYVNTVAHPTNDQCHCTSNLQTFAYHVIYVLSFYQHKAACILQSNIQLYILT